LSAKNATTSSHISFGGVATPVLYCRGVATDVQFVRLIATIRLIDYSNGSFIHILPPYLAVRI
tara:strand:- start:73 stop:261 length:189 start_codon:yes stop_codon:yes gene_type:complete